MNKNIRKNIIKTYGEKIEGIKSKYDLGGFMIDISKKTSSYVLNWDEFMLLRKMASVKATELKIGFRY